MQLQQVSVFSSLTQYLVMTLDINCILAVLMYCVNALRSLSCELDNQTIATNSEIRSLALLDNRLCFVSRAESHETSSLGFAVFVEQDVDLAHIEVK